MATFVAALTVPLNPGADSFGVDFNPVPDSANPTMPSLRVVNNLDQNLRVQAVSGVNAPGTTFVDTNLNYQAGDVNFGQNPTVGEVAYTNNVPGATSTTLLGIDTRLNVLVQVTSANGGTLRTLGTLDGNFESLIGFDVSGFSGIGFAALTSDDGLTRLFTVNTSNAPGIVNNRATAVGLIGDGLLPLRGLMALTPGINAVPEPATLAMAGFGLGVVGLAAIRRRAKA